MKEPGFIKIAKGMVDGRGSFLEYGRMLVSGYDPRWDALLALFLQIPDLVPNSNPHSPDCPNTERLLQSAQSYYMPSKTLLRKVNRVTEFFMTLIMICFQVNILISPVARLTFSLRRFQGEYARSKKKVKVPSYVNDSIGEGQGGLDKNDLEDRFKGAMSKDLCSDISKILSNPSIRSLVALEGRTHSSSDKPRR